MTSDARPPSDRPCLCGLTSGACPAHTYGGDVCACSTPGETHSPAIHARPPSDTGTTGWHIHANGQGGAWRDDHHPCENPRPVLVVDPAEARETIARTLAAHIARDRYDDEGTSVGTYCTCGNWTGGYFADGEAGPFDDHLADLIAAALAGQGQP